MGTWVSLPENRDTREQEKFDLDDDGKVIIRTSVKGELTPSGLKTGGLITEVTLNSTTWTALPPTPLLNRNAMAIQNESGVEIKINYSDSVPGYVGIKIKNTVERFYNITDSIVLYGKSSSGSATIVVEELA